ncbi:diguanylate cyclase [Thermodesulfobacteriota bacterium]
MKAREKANSDAGQISSKVLDLMLDVILEVMRSDSGSVMLLEKDSQELTIRSAKGLSGKIIKGVRIPFGKGISGKVAANGQAAFLKGGGGDKRLKISPKDLKNPKIEASYVIPVQFKGGTLGTININYFDSGHEIRKETAPMVQGIAERFFDYFYYNGSASKDKSSISEPHMVNFLGKYNTLRELRIVVDYVFDLVTEFLNVPKKGVFLLKDADSQSFDVALGYGLDKGRYREIHEDLIPRLSDTRFQTKKEIEVFERKELWPESETFLDEDHFVLIPFVWEGRNRGVLFIITENPPELDEKAGMFLMAACDLAARTIMESGAGGDLHELAFTDSLTGTYNYGLWWKRLNEELARSRRKPGTLNSIIVLDIDHLEHFNRRHGYIIGDQLLRLIADRIRSCLRMNDIVGRIGGDEFGVLLPDTSKKDTLKVAQRIIDAISNLPSEMRVKSPYTLSLSGGTAGFPEDGETAGDMVENAKTALLSAKIMGGNCIKAFEPLEE